MPKNSASHLTSLSLYTGVGGLDFGFEAAGFDTCAAVELDAVACATLRLNRRWPVLEGDIHEISSRQILKAGHLKVGQADVLIGGPPCQPFSKSGYWKSGDARRLDDPRADTLTAYLRVLRDTKPRVFLLENVPGFAFSGKDEGLNHILEGIDEVNRQAKTKYKVYWQRLNAADYGVPQSRERLFLIGARDGAAFVFPRATHFSVEGTYHGNTPFHTAWDAIGDLDDDKYGDLLDVRGKWGNLLPSIPEGQNYLWHTAHGGGEPLFGRRTRFWSFLLKLAKDKPSWTIQAQPGPAIGPFHWKNRRLSAHELCRLQTFPDGLRFDCSQMEIQRLLGNAVPSLMAEILAWEIRRQLLNHPAKVRRYKLMPADRGNPPAPEPVARVAKTYRHLIGEHAAHPGEGLGRGAVLRKDALVVGSPE